MGSSRPLLRALGLILILILIAGCGPRYKAAPETPLLSASLEELVDRLNERERSIRTLRALLTIRSTGRPGVTGSLSFSRSSAGGPPSLRLKGFDPLGGTLFDLISAGDRVWISVPVERRVFEGALEEFNDPSLPVRADDIQQLVLAAVGPWIEPGELPVLERLETMYLIHLIRVSGTEGRLTKRLWFERGRLRLIRAEWFGGDKRSDHGEDGAGAVVEFDDYQVRSGIDWPGRIAVTRSKDASDEAAGLRLEFREVHFNSVIAPEELRLP